MPGLLLLNKPAGITSFGAVARIKRLTGEKRVGHTGTLDPMATGVLPVLTGRATVLSSFLLESKKQYIATAKLGISTDTLDITGAVTQRAEPNVTQEQLGAALSSFAGEYMQTPPMFSAIKRQGVKMYELARRGEQTKIEPRAVSIYEIKLLSPLNGDNEFTFSATVSKGTYIRSLVRDIGERLSVPAVLCALERTETAGFSLSQCVSLDLLTKENISEYILPADRAVAHLAAVTVTEKQAARFLNGGQLDLDRIRFTAENDNEILRVYGADRFLGLGRADLSSGQLAVKCLV